MTKAEQLKKNRKQNEKKLSRTELIAYKDTILEECNGMCQLCEEEVADDFHHPYFGSRGADKDDRILTATCRVCHTKCHQSKHGALNTKAKDIGINNRRIHNG